MFEVCSEIMLLRGIAAAVVVTLAAASGIVCAVCRNWRRCSDTLVRLEVAGLFCCLVCQALLIWDTWSTMCVEDRDDGNSLWLWTLANVMHSGGYFFLVRGELQQCKLSERFGILLLLSGGAPGPLFLMALRRAPHSFAHAARFLPLLLQQLNFKLLGFPYLVGIIKFNLFSPWLLEK